MDADAVRRVLLDKLEEGTYCVCDSFGRVIPEGRLEIHPWAVRCVACAG